MKISAGYDGNAWRVMNKGRLLTSYPDDATFDSAMGILNRLCQQLERPEAFCDCKPKQEVLR
jgi:hypothetical protein